MSKSSFGKLINSKKPVLIDFYADWCGPCKMLSPIIADIKNELKDSIRVIKIDVDKNQELCKKLNVMSMPTLMIFQNGVEKWSTVGVQTKELIKSKLTPLI